MLSRRVWALLTLIVAVGVVVGSQRAEHAPGGDAAALTASNLRFVLHANFENEILTYGVEVTAPGNEQPVDCIVRVEFLSMDHVFPPLLLQLGHNQAPSRVNWKTDIADLARKSDGQRPTFASIRLYGRLKGAGARVYQVIDERLIDLRESAE